MDEGIPGVKKLWNTISDAYSFANIDALQDVLLWNKMKKNQSQREYPPWKCHRRKWRQEYENESS